MIVIVSQNQAVTDEIDAMLAKQNYANEIIPSLERLSTRLEGKDVLAAFIDIDSVPVDNRSIRMLTRKHPAIYFFCLSRDKFHPEIKDAICYHIYACLNKPIDPDELIYWLRSIEGNGNDTRGSAPTAPKAHTDESI